ESGAGGVSLGTGRHKTRARARVFMIGSHLHHGHHMRPRFTEPFCFFSLNARIAFADAARSRAWSAARPPNPPPAFREFLSWNAPTCPAVLFLCPILLPLPPDYRNLLLCVLRRPPVCRATA